MKKLLYILCTLPLLWACSEKEDATPAVNQNENATLPSTEVFVQGGLIDYTSTRAGEWPQTNDGWDAARFYIRIDGRIPGYTNQDPLLYWGRYAGTANWGKVANLFPYQRYNDRDYDYFESDKKTGENIGLFRYVYDPKGVQTLPAILEQPTVRSILEEEIRVYQADINKNYNVEAAQQKVDALNALLDKEGELKVIWYVVKEVGRRYGWHVDGVLTTEDVDNVTEIPSIGPAIEKDVEKYDFEESNFDPSTVPDNVEVDIHLQEHKDWNEIKTSTHIRTDAGSVTINMPLSEEYIVEQDDFAVRFYDYYYKEFDIKHEITHDANGITIKIDNIEPEFIQELKARYGDGLTVEVHSYCTQLDGIWQQLKKSTVVTGKPCTLKGQVTSAYDADDVVRLGE